MLIFIFFTVGYLIYSRIMAYSLAPTMKPADFHGLAIWEIPLAYLVDYFSHGWICLLFAFVAAGLIYEFIPKEAITKYMGGNKVTGYGLAIGMAPFLTVCSCTMVPLFAGVLYTGAGIGPAMTFLLMAPAANILSILLTGEIISWELAGVRIIVSLVVALTAGIIVSKTPWEKAIEKEHQQSSLGTKAAIEIVKLPLDERLWASLKFAGYIAKKSLPFFLLGLVAVSYVVAYLPEDIVGTYLTGVTGVLIASVIGGPLYTPTLLKLFWGRECLIWARQKGRFFHGLWGNPMTLPTH